MTNRNIQARIDDIYGYELSPGTTSTITGKMSKKAKELEARPLKRVYSIVFMDAV